MADARLAVAINMKKLALSQYANFDFNSMTMFNGVPLAASADGIFSLFDANTDDGVSVDAIVETVLSNFGIPTKKKPRRMYVSLEASGDMVLKLKTDDGDYKIYQFTPDQVKQLQHRVPVDVGSKHKGDFWLLRVENKSGCDFSIDAIDMLFIILGMSR